VRLGIFGGSFDPPHLGHLLVASDAVDTLGLDRLVFVPARVQPLKGDVAGAAAPHRLAMVRLLAGDDPRFGVDPIEIERDGLSFTVDTLQAFAERFPTAERFFLAGADVLTTFPQWREPGRILQLATLALLRRAAEHDARPLAEALPVGMPPEAMRVLATRRVDVSSTEVRARVRAGKSIRGFVPDAIANYVATAGLYRTG